jgi:hypothetical protein
VFLAKTSLTRQNPYFEVSSDALPSGEGLSAIVPNGSMRVADRRFVVSHEIPEAREGSVALVMRCLLVRLTSQAAVG